MAATVKTKQIPVKRSDLDRLLEKVQRTASGCWQYTGAKDPRGYGRFGIGRGVYLAHRVAYTAIAGPIPDGLVLDHLCRNHGCVNPEHLDPVDQGTNLMRGEGTHKTECKHGHEMSTENTYTNPRGHRACRECLRAGERRRVRVRA